MLFASYCCANNSTIDSPAKITTNSTLNSTEEVDSDSVFYDQIRNRLENGTQMINFRCGKTDQSCGANAICVRKTCKCLMGYLPSDNFDCKQYNCTRDYDCLMHYTRSTCDNGMCRCKDSVVTHTQRCSEGPSDVEPILIEDLNIVPVPGFKSKLAPKPTNTKNSSSMNSSSYCLIILLSSVIVFFRQYPQ